MSTDDEGRPLQQRVGRRLSPWFDGGVNPKRRGVYRIQDHSMGGCPCCWMDAHWDGEDWHTKTPSEVGVTRYLTLMFKHRVRRWRGLVTPNI